MHRHEKSRTRGRSRELYATPAKRPSPRVRYSDSTSNPESCASDYTADSTIHSRHGTGFFRAQFRPRSPNEPPVPAGFLRNISCSDEQDLHSCGRMSEGWTVPHVAARRGSIDSQLSEYSGYVSPLAPSPRRADHRVLARLSDDQSDSDAMTSQKRSPYQRPRMRRNSSAESSVLFVWSGLAHARGRESCASTMSEYSGGVSDASPRSSSLNRVPIYRRFPQGRQTANARTHSTAHKAKRRGDSHSLHSYTEHQFERRHSYASSNSSGRSLADFLEHEGDDDDDDVAGMWEVSSLEDDDAYRKPAFVVEKPRPREHDQRRVATRATAGSHETRIRKPPPLLLGHPAPHSPPPTPPTPPIAIAAKTAASPMNSQSRPEQQTESVVLRDNDEADRQHMLQHMHMHRHPQAREDQERQQQQQQQPAAALKGAPEDEAHPVRNKPRSTSYQISRPYAVLQGEEAIRNARRSRSFFHRVKVSLFG